MGGRRPPKRRPPGRGGEKNKQLNAGGARPHHATGPRHGQGAWWGVGGGCGKVRTVQGAGGHGYAAGAAANGRAGVLCTPGVCFKHGLGGHAVERRAQARREALTRSRNPKGMFAKLAASRPRAHGVRSASIYRTLLRSLRCHRCCVGVPLELRGSLEFPARRARSRGFLAGEKLFTDGVKNMM